MDLVADTYYAGGYAGVGHGVGYQEGVVVDSPGEILDGVDGPAGWNALRMMSVGFEILVDGKFHERHQNSEWDRAMRYIYLLSWIGPCITEM